ncbi:MAG: serine O-acetyltransferase [Bacteroidota bacterium]
MNSIQADNLFMFMRPSFTQKILASHQSCTTCPPPFKVVEFFRSLMALLYKDYSETPFQSAREIEVRVQVLKLELDALLSCNQHNGELMLHEVSRDFFDRLEEVYDKLNEDVNALYKGDPAAKSESEIIRSYPGFYATAAYRVAHELHSLGIVDLPRIITEHAHSQTGIDIHPAAKIGRSFCMDHGTGIVIGETTDIGDHVKIYQGVTLGALSVRKEDANIKRHPIIEDRVVIYSGATILGGQTKIGHDSVIGGNVWITSSVPPHAKVYYQVGHQTMSDLPE